MRVVTVMDGHGRGRDKPFNYCFEDQFEKGLLVNKMK